MQKSTEKDTLQYLIDYLQKQGYPDDSLLFNYKEGKYRADLVIVDTATLTPLQIFEVRNKLSLTDHISDKDLLKQHLSETSKSNPDIIGYLVYASKEEPFFEVIDPFTDKPVRESAFDYNNQVQKGKNAKFSLLKNNKSKAVGNLKFVTMSLIFSTIFILLLDVFNIVEITGYRLYLILIIVILVLLPYYETIKVANFELTQKDKDK